MALSNMICIRDLEVAAKSILSKTVLEYFNDGSEEGLAVASNLSAFDKYKIRQRVLRDVSNVKTEKKAFGKTMSFPLAIAPSGMQCMAHENGERATARAATKAGVFMGVSTFATTALEDVKRSGDEFGENVYLLQLYIFKNRKTTENLVKRAEKAGYKGILLTCDTPKLGNRYNMTRNNFKLPPHLNLPNFGKEKVGPLIQHVVGDGSKQEDDSNINDDSITWDEALPWLRSITNMEIWLKGISTAEDVRLAAQSPANVAGIVVSNHGGRQLESAMATLDSLPECVQAAKSGNRPLQVWVDGGIKKGSDIFKALALGADGVMIGRIPLWGLAIAGEQGVSKALEILKAEFQHTMALAGCKTLSDITPSSLARVTEGGFYAKL
ncbi:FMN-dependent alpha-hydroxy acid dehydrogenase [Hypoxylon trugodes]|uniref:FMN-dependent alpha-hydroxy acid dehydrogenase n=1 Tax=Hypoxylon trugodes TaxID=326681 RepID=UPI0021967DB5|nr:FMN-dependent alpha-hydroxy acid dehydrogenase [Hypoxylon trugodes]KAI1384985.1 FMN-dependent alpha-hydroxy acid dehydrogenase [Hypoxylon trugodes]